MSFVHTKSKKAKENLKRISLLMRQAMHIFGINLPEWTKTLIWLIGLVVLIGLTVKDFSPLLDDYFENNKATQINIIVISNSSFQQPQLTLHMPHYKDDMRQGEALMTITNHLLNGTEADCIECRALTNVSWDVWRNMNITKTKYDPDSLYNALTIALVGKLLNGNDSSDDALSDENSDWNEPLITAGINFLIQRAHLDYWFAPPELGLQSLLNETQKNLDRLFDRVMKAVCRGLEFAMKDSKSQYNSDEIDTNKTCVDFLLNSTTPVILDNRGLWFALPRSDSIRHTFFLWPLLLSSFLRRDMWTPHHTSRANRMPLLLYSDTTVQYGSAVEPDKVELFEISTTSYFRYNYVSVKYKTSMKTKEDRMTIKDSCYKETNPDLCLAKCTKKWTVDNCRCIPFTYRTGLDLSPKDRELPYCTESMYNACDPLSTREQQREQCLKTTCKNACSYTTYDWQITHSVAEARHNELQLEMQILPQLDPFVEFTLTDKSTPEQFLSAVGGLLSFYLGLSGLSLFVFIISFMDFVKRYFRARKTGVRPRDINSKKVSLWQETLNAVISWRLVSLSRGIVQLKEDSDNNNQQTTFSSLQDSDTTSSENETMETEIDKELEIFRAEFQDEIEAVVKEQLKATIDDLKKQLNMPVNNDLTNFDIDKNT